MDEPVEQGVRRVCAGCKQEREMDVRKHGWLCKPCRRAEFFIRDRAKRLARRRA